MHVNIHWMEVLVTAAALEEFTKLPRVIQTRVIQLTGRLAHWPKVSGAKPLSGNLAGHYRLRTGDYRVQFRVDGVNVIVERIGHRDGFYDE
ncbi:MAG: type II toxin-antitoxin system RelE/ParE family toxin [Pirellulales bacterium]